MKITLQQNLRKFRFFDGSEEVVLLVRQPTAPELSRFLSKRFQTHRNKLVNRLYEARLEFADSILADARGLEVEKTDGSVVPLGKDTELSPEDLARYTALLGSPVRSWKDLVPAQWKNSLAARFEEGEADEMAADGDDAVPL